MMLLLGLLPLLIINASLLALAISLCRLRRVTASTQFGRILETVNSVILPPLAVFTHTDDWGQLERWSLLSLLSDCKYAVWADAILRPDNYFHNCLEMPCLAVVSHGNVTTPACVLACAHLFYLHDCDDAVRTDSGDVD